MSSTRVVLVAVTVIGPDLPLGDHSGHCCVCFCGQPFPRTNNEGWACQACGYVPPWRRRMVGLHAEADRYLAELGGEGRWISLV